MILLLFSAFFSLIKIFSRMTGSCLPTKLFRRTDSDLDTQDLQKDLNQLSVWSQHEQLSFHVDKCKSHAHWTFKKYARDIYHGISNPTSQATIGVASYGALGHVPPLDFQLVILGSLALQTLTSHGKQSPHCPKLRNCQLTPTRRIARYLCDSMTSLCQVYYTGGRAPSPQSTTRKHFKRTNTENVQNNAIFAQFLSTFGQFLSFFCPQFSPGSNYSSQNAGTIANKFQLHTYFRFR